MPLSQTGSYSDTYIKITYRCQRIKRSLTRTHISMPWSYSYITIRILFHDICILAIPKVHAGLSDVVI
ncbi:Valine--tRNA ligase [Gossypium arboreum]|uniref:Valine--tRNA ligase n=1 Tax=Gossypium arboreum TaxID=29729 RepID=A0A0B0NCL9_GOSAR|nr:Valine--tRNA ligase [Gossypium arboreum]